jgi:hypothetical protein
MQSQDRNFINRSTIYDPSFNNTIMNTSFYPQHNNSSNINNVQDVPVALDNMTQVTTPCITPPTLLNMNENQAFNIQAMTSNNTLQHMQDYHSLLAHSQETVVMSEHTFFYAPCDDFQIYHITCKEISFSFESISQSISNNIDDQPNNVYVFYHEQPEIKKIYKVTCEIVSHTFIFQFLNKVIYNIQFIKCEHQQQEFSKRQRENLIFHLKKDLIHYLVPKKVYEDNYNLHKRFIQDYYTYESVTHSQQCNTNFVFPFDQSYDTFQQDNNNQIIDYNNYSN